MSDQNPGTGDAEEPEDDESDGDEYEVERLLTREEGATVLRQLADGVANGSVELDDGEVTATVPERFELELEYEREDEKAELEAELEWPVVDGEAVGAEREFDEDEREETGGTETGEGGAESDDADEDEESTEADDSAAKADAGTRADIVGVGGAASSAQFELYRDRANEWRWRLVHDNGNIIADSGEGYDRKATARKGLESVMRNAPGADVVENTD